jgi:hypothetical protein
MRIDGKIGDPGREAKLEAALEFMTNDRADWRAFARKLDQLLACYRVGKRPSGKLLDEVTALRERLGED